jgi:hypothetical protein
MKKAAATPPTISLFHLILCIVAPVVSMLVGQIILYYRNLAESENVYYKLWNADPRQKYAKCPADELKPADIIDKANLMPDLWLVVNGGKLVPGAHECEQQPSSRGCLRMYERSQQYMQHIQPKKQLRLNQLRDRVTKKGQSFFDSLIDIAQQSTHARAKLNEIATLGYHWITQSRTLLSLHQNGHLGNCFEVAVWQAYRKIYQHGWQIHTRLHLIHVLMPNNEGHSFLYWAQANEQFNYIKTIADLKGKIIDPYFKVEAFRKDITDEGYLSLEVSGRDPIMHLSMLLDKVRELPNDLQDEVLELLHPFSVPNLDPIFCSARFTAAPKFGSTRDVDSQAHLITNQQPVLYFR